MKRTIMKDELITRNFSWGLATYCAKLSMHAYQSEDGFRKQMERSWLDIKFFDFGGTQAYALNSKKNYILVFRGTEPTSWSDIKADMKFRKVSSVSTSGIKEGRVHRGFKAALDLVWDDIKEHMTECGTYNKNIIITGHSLGGALATLVAGRLDNADVVLYTFGAPRVGNAAWNKNQKFLHYRFRNNNDIVTRVPPRWIGYQHNGKLMYFDYKEMYNTGSGSWYMFNNWIMGMYRGWFSLAGWDSFSDHDISTYYKICRGNMVDDY